VVVVSTVVVLVAGEAPATAILNAWEATKSLRVLGGKKETTSLNAIVSAADVVFGQTRMRWSSPVTHRWLSWLHVGSGVGVERSSSWQTWAPFSLAAIVTRPPVAGRVLGV
jgi:hypothetical protein